MGEHHEAKVVLYGPALAGKSTTLWALHSQLPPAGRTAVRRVGSPATPELTFSAWPRDPIWVDGSPLRLNVHTVPGEWEICGANDAVLHGAEGIVFVADSTPGRIQDDVASFQRMESVLRNAGVDPHTLPLVMQWNKRDHPHAVPTALLQERLSRYRYEAPSFATTAERGEGVMVCLQVVAWLIAERLRRRAREKARR